MKPQSLQDAIKAQALKKAKARESGAWKEPVVKVHKVTADELKQKGRPIQSPQAVSSCYSSAPAAAGPDLSAITHRIGELSTLVNSQRTDLQSLQSDLDRAKREITKLQEENRSFKGLKEQVAELKRLVEKNTTMSSNNNKNNSFSNSISSLGFNNYSSSPPVSPTKQRPPVRLEPHSAEDLLENQRRDTALREFMKTKQGLYDPKYLSIREDSIVCFKKRIYIPKKLREKSIQYFKNQHPVETEALAALRKNFCWPELEKDFFNGVEW